MRKEDSLIMAKNELYKTDDILVKSLKPCVGIQKTDPKTGSQPHDDAVFFLLSSFSFPLYLSLFLSFK